MIRAYYTICPQSVEKKSLQKMTNSLPESVAVEAQQFSDERRRLKFLISRCMLQQMLNDNLNLIDRSDFGKPYLQGGQNFNISHSGELVICAISDSQRLGVDSELVRKVNLKDYESSLNEDDQYVIKNASNKMKAFYRIWTQKESLTKADGRGVFIDMKDIFLRNMEGYIKGEPTKWRLISFDIEKEYEISICHEWGKEDVKLRRVDEIWN